MTVYRGFGTPRYQQHDALIRELVLDFNQHKTVRCGCTAAQAAAIEYLDPDLIKAWMIQESGGCDTRSLAAWRVDPVQVNVPGDWSESKTDLGLTQPAARNEGSIRANLKAGIALLCRKGFGKSGQRPENRPEASFDGWKEALRRYNGRSDMRDNGKKYSENYAETICTRFSTPTLATPIELP